MKKDDENKTDITASARQHFKREMKTVKQKMRKTKTTTEMKKCERIMNKKKSSDRSDVRGALRSTLEAAATEAATHTSTPQHHLAVRQHSQHDKYTYLSGLSGSNLYPESWGFTVDMITVTYTRGEDYHCSTASPCPIPTTNTNNTQGRIILVSREHMLRGDLYTGLRTLSFPLSCNAATPTPRSPRHPRRCGYAGG